MVTPSQNAQRSHLSPLNTSWHNRSMSSMSATSDTATFHSAHAHLSSTSQMELRPLTSNQTPVSPLRPASPVKPLASPKLESIKMDRQDSGYSDSPQSPSSSRRTSLASSTRRATSPSKNKRKATNGSTHSTSRPSTKRNSRSSAQIRTSTSGTRPSMQQRHTTPFVHTQHPSQSQQYQFFHFPTLSDPEPQPDTISPPPPPATVQYWTSDSTRRLEYAAIDAASKGVRGFFIKLVPDCILPANSRRTKFHCDDADSDAGSVRRYRLALPAEEKGGCSSSARDCVEGGTGGKRDGLLRRWTMFGRRVE
ncbi:uncharacterized protein PAC_16185 [Phialocephala subalpina]|uniref:Uncharacterized protein n=1 Tax=Phialocephala subalpina TaxID=576137 RepID=A0A1L7XMQ4_9HELO|nr:uncharacterized protein PAC_16185 [Phialocephala subalpina]